MIILTFVCIFSNLLFPEKSNNENFIFFTVYCDKENFFLYKSKKTKFLNQYQN